MKKISFQSVLIFLFIRLSFAVVSCKKDKSTGPSGDAMVSFKLDGVQKTFKVGYGFHKDIGIDSWWVVGSETNDTTSNSLVMYAANDGTITTDFAYNEGNCIIPIKVRTASAELLYNNYQNSFIRFSRLGSDRVTGTFSGTLKDATGNSKIITDGTFDVPVKN